MVDVPEHGKSECHASAAGLAEVSPLPSSASADLVHGVVGTETLPLLEETLTVSKRRRSTGSVRISTRTDTTEATAELELRRYGVDVSRVPKGHVVDGVPSVRTEGDTTIVPIVEERFVVVKQLFLVEELHIRQVAERTNVSETVTLRRQHASVERRDADGNLIETDGKILNN